MLVAVSFRGGSNRAHEQLPPGPGDCPSGRLPSAVSAIADDGAITPFRFVGGSEGFASASIDHA
jgi:hypothetical protein